MRLMFTLIRKNLLDSRWLLLICGSSLFGLCWLFVFFAHRAEVMILTRPGDRRMGMLRGMGGLSMDFSSAAIVMAYWNVPFITLIFAIWAIARGSGSVAGEIEKGTIDLVLSRPVDRSAFLLSQVIASVLGLVLMGAAMVAGSLASGHYNSLITPVSASTVCKPALNLVAFGWAIFGYSLALSTLDIVRWRPTMIASVVTLASFIALFVSTIPQPDMKWLEKFTIYKAYDPVEAVVKGENLVFNAGLLGVIGLVGVVLGFLIFARRDLPAGS